MNLTLDIPLYATDLTACIRCGTGSTLADMVTTTDHKRICLACVGQAVEQHRLNSATDLQPVF
ncbi:hypothetical protein [Nonomuraea recticatena]|uniref:ClpX-type ZB domain-containing protein n=1 Tax=Nonomuraea recticatena TaxID=46178 RepID=A0ABN3S798_9ACTN